MTEPVRAEDLRVSDSGRSAVAQHLQRAQTFGLLDIHEYDERPQAVPVNTAR